MKITYNHKTVTAIARSVTVGSLITLECGDAVHASRLHRQLTDIGLHCCCTGDNAPCGATVVIYKGQEITLIP